MNLEKLLTLFKPIGKGAAKAAPSLDDIARSSALSAMRANVERDIPDIARRLVSDEGFTYDPITGQFLVPRAFGGGDEAAGYAVSVAPRDQEILLGAEGAAGSPGNVIEADLMAAYDELVNRGTMTPGVNFGGFLSEDAGGRYAIDPAELIGNRRDAMRRARALGQEGVFDFGAPTYDQANLTTKGMRSEFRRQDAKRAAQIAALLSMLGISGEEGGK
jgi:hypothetical protein